jgi:LmbE family N-acetylglucosaminyl deacetylase
MKVLFIFPHPDDETIFCGGTIARHVKSGDEVVWISAGLGERSQNSAKRFSKLFFVAYSILGSLPFLIIMQKAAVWWLSIFRKRNRALAEIRKKEALDVAKALGISKVIFLEIEDMRFGKYAQKIKGEIKKYIGLYKPEIIYTFHPNGLTGHPDHTALSQAVIESTKELSFPARPKIFGAAVSQSMAKKLKLPIIGVKDDEIVKEINLSDEELTKKKEALAKYRSQSYIWDIFLEKHPEALKNEYFSRIS